MAPIIRSLAQVFADLRSRKQIGLLPFVPAGYPDLATTEAILPALESGGASAIEVGIPFSDPIADGPTIQEAFNVALGQKLRVADVFQSIARTRSRIALPLISMVSYSIVYRYGARRYFSDAVSAGFNGLILPDVPPPEAAGVCAMAQSAGLDTILLVSPTTSAQRRKQIAGLCTGFVYYLSVTGITGARDQLPADLAENVRQLRSVTQVPVCVGFGISTPEHIKQLAPVADGAIVGSALVKKINESRQAGPAGIAAALGRCCSELLSQVR